MNYPPTAKLMGWASGFTDLCFFAEVLFESPPVFSTVPAEFNIFNPSLRMFFAAFKSRSNTCPFLQVHSLIERFKSWFIQPHSQQVFELGYQRLILTICLSFQQHYFVKSIGISKFFGAMDILFVLLVKHHQILFVSISSHRVKTLISHPRKNDGWVLRSII